MPRIQVPHQNLLGAYADAGLAVAETANDMAEDHYTPFSADVVLYCRNSGAAPHNLTVTSSEDSHGRTNDLTQAIAAGAVVLLGPFARDGWAQAGGQLWFEGDSADLRWAAVRIPR